MTIEGNTYIADPGKVFERRYGSSVFTVGSKLELGQRYVDPEGFPLDPYLDDEIQYYEEVTF